MSMGMNILTYYLLSINFITWVAYGLDKGRAKKGKWRIQERTLLILTAAGGSVEPSPECSCSGTRQRRQNLSWESRSCWWRIA